MDQREPLGVVLSGSLFLFEKVSLPRALFVSHNLIMPPISVSKTLRFG
jgi:hypothetical protein